MCPRRMGQRANPLHYADPPLEIDWHGDLARHSLVQTFLWKGFKHHEAPDEDDYRMEAGLELGGYGLRGGPGWLRRRGG